MRASVSTVCLPGFLDLFHLDHVEGIVRKEAEDSPSALPFHQHLHCSIGKLQPLNGRPQRTHAIDVLILGVIDLGILLQRKKDLLVLFHRGLDRLDGSVPADKNRDHHVGKEDDIPEGKERNNHVLAFPDIVSTCSVFFFRHRYHPA